MRICLAIVLAAGAAVGGAAALYGCSNSILRNAGEAGVETVIDAPLPTPTPHPQSGR